MLFCSWWPARRGRSHDPSRILPQHKFITDCSYHELFRVPEDTQYGEVTGTKLWGSSRSTGQKKRNHLDLCHQPQFLTKCHQTNWKGSVFTADDGNRDFHCHPLHNRLQGHSILPLWAGPQPFHFLPSVW